MADPTNEAQALRNQLDRLFEQLPRPQTVSHPHRQEIADFRRDFAAALDKAERHPEALSILESILATEDEASFDPSAAADLRAAWERLTHFPLPYDAEHPFLSEILPAVEALRFLLVALSRCDTAALRSGRPPAPGSAGSS